MIHKKSQKVVNLFHCIICDYKTSRKCDFDKHISTLKHQRIQNDTLTDTQKSKLSNIYKCNCGNEYKYHSGYYRHKKKCINTNSNTSSNLDNSTLIIELLKQNSEFKELIIEQNKNLIELSKDRTMNYCNNNITNNNNHFNLNLFLNETCKNAMSITEFVEQIPVTINDLENTARLGYVEGISKIFIKGLKDLEVNERPIHCSDGKRETLYIKEGDIWEKDDSDKTRLTNAIRKVGHKNIRMIPEWKKKYPDCEDYYSNKNDLYLKIVNQSMCGGSEEETETNYNKIRKKIIKEVIIEK
jgi:hypothetical protein